jgi:hypothetical protein
VLVAVAVVAMMTVVAENEVRVKVTFAAAAVDVVAVVGNALQ